MSGSGRDRLHRVIITNIAFYPGYKAGGPVKSVAEILDRLDGSASCLLLTSDRDLGDTTPYPGLSGTIVERGTHQIFYIDRSNPRHWLRALRLARETRPDVLYLNSFWCRPFTVLPITASILGLIRPRRILLAARGNLNPGALSIKATKKQLFFPLWSRVLKLVRPTFHASTDIEAEHISAALPWSRSIVQINTAGPPARATPVQPRETVRFVFFSRISRIKNLGLALEALAVMSNPVELDVYGPLEEPDLWAEYTAMIDRLPATATVRYCGELSPESVGETVAQYDAFVFPTLGENFGHVIAESLAAGCPVICSAETPWNPTLEDGGGVVVPRFAADDWAAVLDAWAARPVAERHAAKAATLAAYRRWQESVEGPTAIEILLEESLSRQ